MMSCARSSVRPRSRPRTDVIGSCQFSDRLGVERARLSLFGNLARERGGDTGDHRPRSNPSRAPSSPKLAATGGLTAPAITPAHITLAEATRKCLIRSLSERGRVRGS